MTNSETVHVLTAGTQVRPLNFICGQEHSCVENVVRQILDGTFPAEQSPVLFYGAVGSGRTLLLQILSGRSGSVLLTSAADLYRKFIQSIEHRAVEVFCRKCNEAELLLMDDLDLIGGKESFQTQLRFIFDERKVNGRITVATAAAIPVPALEQSLNLRLQQGLMLRLAPPELETRIYYLRQLAETNRITLTEPELRKLAAEWAFSIPRINAAFIQRFLFLKQPSQIAEDKPVWTMPVIVKRTAKHFGCKLTDLTGTARTKTIAAARSAAVCLVKQLSSASVKEIAAYFHRDVSTIRHLAGKIAADIELQRDVTRLTTEFQEKKR